MDKKKVGITLVVVIGFGLLWRFFTFYTTDDAQKQQDFNDKYYVFALNTPKNISFAGEHVPTEQFDVRERIDRELLTNTYWQSQTMLLHKRSNRWFSVITRILKHNNIPDDFKYLALAESGFTHVTSPAGAVGFWQFIESTGKSYGLEINDEVDERYNVEKSTEAACRYFKEAYALLGNWSLVAASYNMGIGGVKKQVEKQRVNSYFDLLLNDETFRYVFRVLALKEVISKPRQYGYRFRKSDLYTPFEYTYVTVDTGINNLAEFAIAKGTNYKYLKLLNPWLRQNYLSNKQHKPYQIKILKPGYTGIDLDTDANNAVLDTTETRAVKKLKNLNEQTLPPSPAVPSNAEKITHKVKKHETLISIAKEYNVSIENLKEWNSINNKEVKKGDELIIYTAPKQEE